MGPATHRKGMLGNYGFLIYWHFQRKVMEFNLTLL